MQSKQIKAWALATTLFTGMAVATPAFAQEADSEEEAQRDTITVTGSRIVRQDFTANSPVTTVTAETLELSQTLTLESFLNELPQVIPGNNQSSNNAGGFDFATIDLRGLGANRNLVLVNGFRLPPSATSGAVSLDNIPTGLVERVEVVTGGASAVYGSDAMSGVVNFILQDDYEGAEISYNYTVAEDGNSPRHAVDFLLGGNFDNDRGNIVMAGSYYSRGSVLQSEYEYSQVAAAIYGVLDGGGALVDSFVEDDLDDLLARRDQIVAGGGAVIPLFSGGSATPPWGVVSNNASNPFQNLDTALPGIFGAVDLDCDPSTPDVPFSSGSLAFDRDTGALEPQFSGGFGCRIPNGPFGNSLSSRYNFAPDNYIVIPAERYNFSVFSTYDLPRGITWSNSILYNHIENQVQLAATPATGLVVSVANPFIPADLATALATRPNPNADFVMNWRATDVGNRISDFDNKSLIFQTGLEGQLGNGWLWSADYIFSKVESVTDSRNSVNRTAIAQGLQGCPATGALPGCEWVNIFGAGNLTDSMASFLRTDTRELGFSERHHITAFLTGELFELPAGAVAFATGFEWREDEAGRVVDDAQRNGDIYGFNAVQNIAGSTRVAEIYGEAIVPLVGDLPFAELIEAEVGYRLSEYNTGTGTVDSWKAGINWTVNDILRFRTMYNVTVRAPSAFELFQNGDQGFPGYTDPCNASASPSAAVQAFCITQGVPAAALPTFAQANSQVEAFAFGDPGLGPETGETFTIGLVATPELPFGDLSVTLDYYDIEISDVISTVGAGTILANCFDALDLTDPFCARITRDPSTGQIDFINTGRENSGLLTTSGIDLQLVFSTDLPVFGLDGRLTVNNLLTWVEEWGSGTSDIVGTTTGQIGSAFPEYKNAMTVTYALPSVTGQVRWTYVDSMEDRWFGTGNDWSPDTEEIHYVDASVRWDMTDTFSTTFGVQNVFDQFPEQHLSSVIGGQGNVDPQNYRALGRMFSITLRNRF
ncbi:MAG: TonB-dependent receptor [Oceanicaulis sp.]